MKKTAIAFIALFFCLKSFCQTFTTRLIFTDTKDSLLSPQRHAECFFDEKGNYCFMYYQEDRTCFLTNKKKINFKTYGEESTVNFRAFSIKLSTPDKESWYYKTEKGVNIFGPVIGEERSLSTDTREHVAITFRHKDTIYYYINDRLVAKKQIDGWDISSFSDNKWCAFSENGNTIYFVEKNKLYYLFVNNRLVDISKNQFENLKINDNGKYLYAKDLKSEPSDLQDSFFIHTNDTVFGPVNSEGNFCLTQNNAFYYLVYGNADDHNSESIIINNHLEKGVNKISKIILCDSENYLYEDRKDSSVNVNVNGKQYSYSLSQILLPSLNKNGEFAFYGIQNYYLYKFINGKQLEAPISKYGVRATPVYISPKGESLHYFKTDDSIYLYRDDSILFRPLSKSDFKLTSYNDEKNRPYPGLYQEPQNGNSLFYLEYDTTAYWIYNGIFSKPMHICKNKDNRYEDNYYGEIITQDFNDNGFFVIQKTGKFKYLINVNNRIYQEVKDVDIYKDNYFFNDKELIFYGVKDHAVYQFKLTL